MVVDEFYKMLDESSIELDTISDFLKTSRDRANQENQSDLAMKFQWELNTVSFRIENGILVPMFAGVNDSGEQIQYPNMNDFNEEALNYIAQRLSITNNVALRARYAHLLWQSPKKKIEYAQIAINSFIELVKIFEDKDVANPQEHQGLYVLKSIQCAFELSALTKYKIDEIRNEILRLVRYYSLSSESAFAIRFQLIELMLQQKKIFDKQSFKDIPDLIWNLSDLLIQQNRHHNAIDLLILGERIDAKCQSISFPWINKQAEIFEILMLQNENNPLGAITFCQNALHLYSRLKNEKKISELEMHYNNLRKKISLSQLSTEVDMTDTISQINKIADDISDRSSVEIIKTLMLSPSLFPKYDEIEKLVEIQAKEFPLSFLFASSVIDSRGHHAEHFTVEQERKYMAILRNYDAYMQMIYLYQLQQIIMLSIKKHKLSAPLLIDFFRLNTWFSNELHQPNFTGSLKTYNWLDLLTPAIEYYFYQLELLINDAKDNANFVLCIDSLALKIEGLLRDLCEFNGESTFFIARTDYNSVMREKDINALLHSNTIKQIFNVDDQFLFKFVLIEQMGFNVRNKVAHALLRYDQYSHHLMNLLIVIIIKISNIRFNNIESGTFA